MCYHVVHLGCKSRLCAMKKDAEDSMVLSPVVSRPVILTRLARRKVG
uniref:Uncharacterized protein n=1 Tax=Parascaris equorum TaxID=6256 RepID=A0A914R5I7_PAREQ